LDGGIQLFVDLRILGTEARGTSAKRGVRVEKVEKSNKLEAKTIPGYGLKPLYTLLQLVPQILQGTQSLISISSALPNDAISSLIRRRAFLKLLFPSTRRSSLLQPRQITRLPMRTCRTVAEFSKWQLGHANVKATPSKLNISELQD
jgi:hypothetical protein